MSEGMMCLFYLYLGGLFLLGVWIGFYAGVYGNDVCQYLKPKLRRKGK